MSKLQEQRHRRTQDLIARLWAQREDTLERLLRIQGRLGAAHKLASRQAKALAKGRHNIHAPLDKSEAHPLNIRLNHGQA